MAQDLICSIHVLAGEAGSDAAAIVNSDIPIVVPSFEISWHPVSPLSGVHSPKFTLPCVFPHFYALDFVEVDGFAVSEGEEVALYDYSIVVDNHVFVLV